MFSRSSALSICLARTRLFFVLSILFATISGSAQVVMLENGRFQRIYSLEELTDNNKYVLISPQTDKAFMLSCNISEGKQKLAGVETKDFGETISNPPGSCIWETVPANGSTKKLVSFEKDVTLVQVNHTDIQLTSDIQSKNATSFNISLNNGIFVFSTGAEEEYRTLSYSALENYFGFFRPNPGYHNFYVYKYVCDTVLTQATDYSPTDTFALGCLNGNSFKILLVTGSKQYSFQDVQDFLLSNKALATDAPVSFWSGSQTKVSDGQGYSLSDMFEFDDGQHRNGRWMKGKDFILLKSDSEDKYFALAYSAKDTTRPRFVEISQMDGLAECPLYSIAQAERAVLKDLGKGIGQLAGGWSKQKLESLTVSNKEHEIDFSKALLPSAIPLISFAQSPNCILYFNTDDSTKLSSGQTHVVLCGKEGNELLGMFEMQDKKPYFFSRSFHVKDGQMTYSRKVYDSNWISLQLPFAATHLPSNVYACKMISTGNGNIIFSKTDTLLPYQKYILKISGVTDSTLLAISSEEQTVQSAPSSLEWMAGQETFPLGSSTKLYVLDEEGKAFTKTTDDSFLYPFRAYFEINSSGQKSLKIQTDIPHKQ